MSALSKETLRKKPKEKDAGFTLVEVLISLFIFALLTTGAYIALAATLDARAASVAEIETVERLAAARRLLADDIATSTLRPHRDGLGDFTVSLDAFTRSDTLELTRRARPNPNGVFPRGDLLRVAWRVERGQLIRAFLPHENPATVEPPLDRVVLDGVERMEVRRVFTPELTSRLNQVIAPNGAGTDTIATIARAFETPSDPPNVSVIDVTLFHSDGATTQHIFEWDPI